MPSKITELKKWIFREAFKKIGAYAFDGNVIHKVGLPESLVEIGGFAFSNNQIFRTSSP